MFKKVNTVANVTTGLSNMIRDLNAEAQAKEVDKQQKISNKATSAAYAAKIESEKAKSVAGKIEELLK